LAWHKVAARLYEHTDRKIGVVLATFNPRYENYALNCGENERVLKAKSAGKIDVALVVAVQRDELGRWVVQGVADAVELKLRVLDNRQVITGAFGSFWALILAEITGEEETW
jgi:hypothetical protein